MLSKMGCFNVLKGKKKQKYEQYAKKRDIDIKDHTSTKLPEPETVGPTIQSAPPSFRNRTEPIQSISRSNNKARARALSAPSSLVVAVDDDSLSMECNDQEEYQGRAETIKDQRFSNPLPLPLPSPNNASILKNMGSFKSMNSTGHIQMSGPLPLPPLVGGLRNFLYEEVSAACQHFSVDRCVSEGLSSTVYKATFGDDATGSKKLEATVTRFFPSPQSLKEFVNEANTISSLQHPQLCKLLGFHAREGCDQRMLVYERLFHGSLDRLLYRRSDGPSIDWSARVKIALSAARGLAFLHEEGPFQAMYNDFSTANIQVDKDFSAKLSGYGCVSYNPDAEILNTSAATANLSIETLKKGLLTPKSNVYSFGIVLLQLLTGRKNSDSRHPKEERNIIRWTKPFLSDDCRLSLIIDPRIKGRFPPKAARTVADIALKCLQKDPSERPTMRNIVESLQNVQDMKCPSGYPLEEPSALVGKPILKYPSFNGVMIPLPKLNCSPPPLFSPRTSMSSSLVPPRTSASGFHVQGY